MKSSARSLIAFVVLTIVCFAPAQESHAQSEPYIGQVALVGFNFCPRGWLPAEGQILEIASNTSLFSLYGTIYGGDGRTTFALPDLRGRAPIHAGTGPGLSTYNLGSRGGVETVALTTAQMPSHNHSFTELTDRTGTTDGLVIRNGGGATTETTSFTGGGEAHENRSPYLVMTYCIATVGIFPSRN